MKNSVSNKITMYNFFMTMGIVIYHFWIEYNVKSTHWTSSALKFFYFLCNRGIGKLAMGMFFLMSAFLLYSGANSVGDTLKKIKRRVGSLIIPFIIWNTFMMLYSFAVGSVNPFVSFKTFILGYTFNPFNGPLWYLLALSVLMLFAPGVIKLKNNKKASICVLIVTIIAPTIIKSMGLNFYPNIVERVWYFDNILTYLPLYAVGAFLGMHYSNKVLQEDYDTTRARIISTPVFFISLIAMCFMSSNLLLIICVISFWLSIESCVFTKQPAKCFKISFFIYVLHAPFLIDVTMRLVKFMCGGCLSFLLPIETVFWRITGTLLIWGLAFAIEAILKRLLPKRVYCMLTGNRVKEKS